MNPRRRYLLEMASATDRLAIAAARGDQRRYADDELYRYAIAFLWLRLAEPATRLLTLRLLDRRAVPAWGLLTTIRNSLAHQRDEEAELREMAADLEWTGDHAGAAPAASA